MATLDGAFRQLTWAEECLVKIKARVENVGKFQNDIMRPKIHKDGAISYSAPNRVPELTHDVGLMLQALRSALDYLIRGLSIHDSGGRKPKHKTQFLIEDEPKVFESRIATRLEGLSDEHIALIRQLQPCHGCNWTRTLRDLNDWQKHNDVIELISIGSARTHISHFAIQTDAPRTHHPSRCRGGAAPVAHEGNVRRWGSDRRDAGDTPIASFRFAC
jgi:hypothetical protein